MTVAELKKYFTKELSALYPSVELQSFFSILSEFFLKWSRLDTVLKAQSELSEEKIKSFKKAIARLKEEEPIQYIIGETEFYGLTFKVNQHTLIPRPETEELVEWIVQSVSKLDELKILDIGTGSGCIPIALGTHLDGAIISGLDISSEALKVARKNAEAHEVMVDFFQADVLELDSLPIKYDLIVSNPPYVREIEKREMQGNVLKFEPARALFVSNENPLMFYKKIAQLAKSHLTAYGFLFFEINEYLSMEMREMLEEEGFTKIEIKNDLFKRPRLMRCCL